MTEKPKTAKRMLLKMYVLFSLIEKINQEMSIGAIKRVVKYLLQKVIAINIPTIKNVSVLCFLFSIVSRINSKKYEKTGKQNSSIEPPPEPKDADDIVVNNVKNVVISDKWWFVNFNDILYIK